MDDRPIGIFDSGVGGLTVVKSIVEIMPEEDIIYFGDTLHFPYGTKTGDQLCKFSREVINFLLERDVKAVVFACNTLSAMTMPQMKKEYEIPIIGTLGAGARAALRASKSQKIGVLGTENIVKSHAYLSQIHILDSMAQVSEKACQRLIEKIEIGEIASEQVEEILRDTLSTWEENEIDALVLGCTHFPFLYSLIRDQLPEKVKLVDPSKEVAREIYNFLLFNDALASKDKKEVSRSFLVSGNPELFLKVGQTLLPEIVTVVEQISLGK